MHTIEFLTAKTNRYTTFYCVFAIIVSGAFLVVGSLPIVRGHRFDGLEVAGVLIGIVFGLLASWNCWAMRNEVIGLEVNSGSDFNLLRPSGQMQRNVQITSRLFTFGCIRFGAPNDAGRLDYSVVRTSVGTVAIPVELYNKAKPRGSA